MAEGWTLTDGMMLLLKEADGMPDRDWLSMSTIILQVINDAHSMLTSEQVALLMIVAAQVYRHDKRGNLPEIVASEEWETTDYAALMPGERPIERSDAMNMVAGLAQQSAGLGMDEAMSGILDVMTSASGRLNMTEMASLAGAGGIICRLGTTAAAQAGDARVDTGTKH